MLTADYATLLLLISGWGTHNSYKIRKLEKRMAETIQDLTAKVQKDETIIGANQAAKAAEDGQVQALTTENTTLTGEVANAQAKEDADVAGLAAEIDKEDAALQGGATTGTTGTAATGTGGAAQ